MTNQVSTLESMVRVALAQQRESTAESLRSLMNGLMLLPMFAHVTAEQAEALARRLEEQVSITQTMGPVLIDRDHRPWLAAARSGIDPYYWNRYRDYLSREGFPPPGIFALDDATDRVLDLMQDPTLEGKWDRRGMVMGHVQSGKTAHYTGLICKAADAGYMLIVVIAGIHNNLRSQTQRRIDEGFVGRDSARLLNMRENLLVGVGNYSSERLPTSLTNTLRDFNKNTATSVGLPLQNLREPAVFVIKKNSSTLSNLIEWLREHSARGGTRTIDLPMLVIDDEADNASINIRKGPSEVSRINGQIRDLLQIFDRSCYIGYTATPYANIFIDPTSTQEMHGEDLFPRSFILSLDPPSDYFGAAVVFADEGIRHVRPIDDSEDLLPMRHTKDFVVTGLPPSLVEAIRCYIVGRAIRLARGHQGQHSSMLVNASRFTDVQRQIRNEIHNIINRILASIRINGALQVEQALLDPELRLLHGVWATEYRDAGLDWASVQQHLLDATASITVVEVNARSTGTLDYSAHEANGFNVIAVGGYSLSRGLTLEGLMVSYFLRNSVMYDTLMQMCRWFGYRQGYPDLCRVWMPEEAQGWYEHIAEATEELRDEIRSMEAQGATPEEFGLRVRSHPDTLLITARNKMGSGQTVKVQIGLAERLIETHMLPRDVENMRRNRHAVTEFARGLLAGGFVPGSVASYGQLFRKIPVENVLEFLRAFRSHPADFKTNLEPVSQYIGERQEDELAEWDVLFAGVARESGKLDTTLGFEIRRQTRSLGRGRDSSALLIGSRQRVSTRGIEQVGLTESKRREAEANHREYLQGKDLLPADGNIQYPDKKYRQLRDRPLLMVHLLDLHERETPQMPVHEAVAAWGISFPKTLREERLVEYVVNTTWLRENYGDDLDEEEMLGDES